MRVSPVVNGNRISSGGVAEDAAAYARQFALGQFVGTDSAMGHRVSYNYTRGSVLYQQDKLNGINVTTDEGDVSVGADTAQLARKHKLHDFTGCDAAMGGRVAFDFKNGFIGYQHGKLCAIEVDGGRVDG
jgi:hypothetical protein